MAAGWSKPYGPPFMPGATAFLDRKAVRAFDTILLRFTINGDPYATAKIVPPGGDPTVALAQMAASIDEAFNELHASSTANSITVQPQGIHEVAAAELAVIPYTVTPATTLLVPAPDPPPPGSTTLALEVVVSNIPLTFIVETAGNVLDDLANMATTVSEHRWMAATSIGTGLIVSAAPGRAVTMSGLTYG